MKDWKKAIRDVPDFPKKGILFKDITTLLADPDVFSDVINEMKKHIEKLEPQAIVAAESRGFIFGAPLAALLKIPFIPVRKKGKLPSETICVTYALEYGEDTICMHKDSLSAGQKVVLIDDLLATGGTAAAMEQLVRKLGAQIISHVFLIELDFLKGRDRLSAPVKSFIRY